MADNTTDGPKRELVDRGQVTRYFLLDADRWLVTGVLLIGVFVLLVSVGYLYPSAEDAIRSSDSVDTLFQGFLTATITGVTLVLTLNQVVLAQELGAVADQRERMEGALAFRDDVADTIQVSVSPSKPAGFLRAIVRVSSELATDLSQATSSTGDADVQSEVDSFTNNLIENAEQVSAGLDDAQFGEFDVISSALDFNYSAKLFTGQFIRRVHGDALGSEGKQALDRLIETLQLFGTAREHFKTLYFQWDLINLSRHILAAAFPALIISVAMIGFFNDNVYSQVVFGVETLVLVIATASTIAVVPFLILLSYVMRIATVTKHTLSIGPFILRDTDETNELN